jgi:MFS family permease
MNRHPLPGIIIQLGFLSLLNDISSEMVFPLLPLFLVTLPGGGPVAIGIIEGVAETTGTFLKLASGIWSDRIRRRVPFVAFGYFLAGIARPLIAFAGAWPAVLVLRFLDRAGKGMRGAPRDAMIADSVEPERRGAAFGFQRMMDHTGAVCGPLAALLLMGTMGLSVRQAILWAGVPSLILIAILFTLREPERPGASPAAPSPPPRPVAGKDFRLLVAAMFVFTLGNSTDAFLILALSGAGVSAASIAFLWSLHNMARIAGAWMGGKSTDRIGSKPVMLAGLGLYALIYLAFGSFDSVRVLVPVFIVYGASIGMLEPAEGAWVALVSSRDRRSTAYGFYSASKGFAALPASIGFGVIWKMFGQFAAFATGAGLASAAALIFLFVREKEKE